MWAAVDPIELSDAVRAEGSPPEVLQVVDATDLAQELVVEVKHGYLAKSARDGAVVLSLLLR